MSKVKVQEATKELSLQASKLLENVLHIRRNAGETLSKLRDMEQMFLQKEHERVETERAAQHRILTEQQSTAYIMPEEEAPAAEPAPVEVVPEVVAEVPAPVVVVVPEEVIPEVVVAVIESPVEPAPQPEPVVEAVQPVAPTQPIPGMMPPRPATAPPFNRAPQPPAAPGTYGRPAPGNPAYGRPPQPSAGPYGRPAPGNPAYGRPAQPVAAGGGGFGRPAQPAGPYGRPATPGAPQRPGAPMGARPAAPGANRRGPELTPVAEKERVSNYDPNKKMYQRQYDQDRSKPRKAGVRELGVAPDDDVFRTGGRKRRKESAQQAMAPIRIEKAFMTAETITVKDLTERIGKTGGEIIKKLLSLGVMATINQELDYDTAGLVCEAFNIELEKKFAHTAEDTLEEGKFEDDEGDLTTRPPVVTIMGHVDHGKTSLLDYIRKTKVTQGEAGGITQHIGAYQVVLNGEPITFLDTPGHEAFTAMRARGAQATDIAVLVVAADDGVMPQTIEAINHAKAAGVPIIIAINKMDKESANPDRVMQDLTAYELVAEAWGGDTIMVPVSAITGQGVDQLLEMILLVADVQQLRANPNRMARGIIIEAQLDKGRGPVATVLVQNGTLHIGDTIVAGMVYGRVRAMVNERGERIKDAPPSTPVEVIGFGEVPDAGDEVNAVTDDRLSRLVAEERRDKQRAQLVKTNSSVSLDDLYSKIAEGSIKDLNLIIKADVQGSVEAVRQSMERLSTSEVRVRTIHGGVGAITENDVLLASTASAIIIGFNVRPENSARELAVRQEVDIRLYRIIYQAIEDVEKAMKGLLSPTFKENILGHAQVRNTFKVTGVGTVAGCYVTDGSMQRNAQVRLLRDNIVVFEGKLDSLKHFKEDRTEIAQGFECGVGLERYNDVKEGDVIECFMVVEVERS